jgi:hypothetical protein
MKKYVIPIVFLLASVAHSQAQDRKVSGTVFCSNDSIPLFAVSISMEGTSYGAITGEKGEFSIKVPDDCPALVFHYLGMKPKRVELPDGRNLSLDVALERDVVELAAVHIVCDRQTLRFQGFTTDDSKATLVKIEPRLWECRMETQDHSRDLRWKSRTPERITVTPSR